MPLSLVRSTSNGELWKACTEAFLEKASGHPGPADHPVFLWLTHRAQRDALLEVAVARGLQGWLDPPIAFFSDLRHRFGIEARPVGILTGRMLVDRLARRHAGARGLMAGRRGGGPTGTHMLDRVFSELLPEGVDPGALRAALEEVGGDDFARRRNGWVADTYEALLRELERRGLYDPRSIHAMVAERIREGALLEAVRGARTLHVYGLTSLRSRLRLFEALAEQEEVDVRAYLPLEPDSEWEPLATGVVEEVPSSGDDPGHAPAGQTQTRAPEPGLTVQPAPDAIREAGWVARQVKRILAEDGVPPHRIAVVARSGHRDTGRIHTALVAAGVPATARLRTVLAEIPALRALLGFLEGQAEDWPYERLRPVLASPYFRLGVDLRAVDYLAAQRRFRGLEAWEAAIRAARDRLDGEDAWRLERRGLFADRLDEDLSRLSAFRSEIEPLREPRPETGWIDATLSILRGDRLQLRRSLCDPVAGRYDIVRLDQRGVLQVESLLREWRDLVDVDDVLAAGEWHLRLARLLSANDLALSTPLQEGVQVLEAHEAALTPFRHVFVVHANDGEFPRRPAAHGVFSDEERRRLRAAGVPLTHREEALRRERTLWRAVTGSPAVTVTYRTTDAAGTPRLPSLLVPKHDAGLELPRTLDTAVLTDAGGHGLSPVSPVQHRRLEVQRVARARRGGNRATLHTPDPGSVRHAVLTAFADSLRDGSLDPFVGRERDLVVGSESSDEPEASTGVDPASLFGRDLPISCRPHAWNGRLRDPVVLSVLRDRFGDERMWSASQLETYGKRPFDFLLERVLYLEGVEEAEEETSPVAYGTVAHAILEEFYRSLLGDLPSALDGRARQAFEAAASRAIAAAETDGDQWLGLPPLWAATRETVREQVRDFVEWELEQLEKAGETPVEVELRFGDRDEPPVRITGTDVRGRPTSLRLRGRVDRIDRAGEGGGAVLRVQDYKSGTSSMPRRTGYQDGALLQTALYMQAVHQLGLGSVDQGRYRSIRERINKFPLKWGQVPATLRLALSIPDRVRAGLFEAVQADSFDLRDWQPGRDITRTTAQLRGGTRFDPVAE